MAKKTEWEGKSAYEEGPLVIQQLDGFWYVIHKQTKEWIMGFSPYKQKKDALAYTSALLKRMNMNFSNKEEMYAVNGGRDNCVRYRNEAYYEGKEDE